MTSLMSSSQARRAQSLSRQVCGRISWRGLRVVSRNSIRMFNGMVLRRQLFRFLDPPRGLSRSIQTIRFISFSSMAITLMKVWLGPCLRFSLLCTGPCISISFPFYLLTSYLLPVGALADLTEGWRILAPGGWLLIHDCFPDPTEPRDPNSEVEVLEVRRAVRDFCAQHKLGWNIIGGTMFMAVIRKLFPVES
jgi:hypothetical protein